ncbi:activator 1 subunit 3 [Trichoderma austrokoningii]
MSDYEDEMDVDGPAPSADITFSAEATKGKRSAANLPVEAEDSLPWVEKYRPVTLDDVSGHQDILATINKFVEQNRLPHLLLYGPPGTGKTSTILALARRIYGASNVRQMVLELNASDDRGIDVVREQIKTFASTKQIFSMGGGGAAKSSSNAIAGFKLIILDEADAMTNTAQMALRRIMEKYTANTRFCIIANYAHKLSPALLSRCTRFRFSPLKEGDIRVLVEKVVEEENVKIQGEAVDALVKLSKGDMRRALNVLQACHASSTPLRLKNEPKPPESEIKRETITTETIYTCIAAPQPDAIKEIVETLLSTPDVTSCLNTINALKTTQGLALADIITAVMEQLTRLEVNVEVMITWLDGLAEIEHRVAGGASEMVQTGAVVGVAPTKLGAPRIFLTAPQLPPAIAAYELASATAGPSSRREESVREEQGIAKARYSYKTAPSGLWQSGMSVSASSISAASPADAAASVAMLSASPSEAPNSSLPMHGAGVHKIPQILPRERVFPIQIGGELFKLSGASLSSDAPSYFSQYFLCQIRAAEQRGEDPATSIRTLYIDRDPQTFRDIALHLQGYYVIPRDGTHFVRLFADAQFYNLPKLISQLNEESIFMSIGHREFQIPRDVLNDPANSPNYFSLGFALFFSQPNDLFPGLDREGLIRPPSILPPSVPNRNADTFAELLRLLRGYPVNIRDENHRQELLRDARYFHFKGIEQQLIPHCISFNPVRLLDEIVLRLENVQKSGVSVPPPTEDVVSDGQSISAVPSGRHVNYARPYVDSKPAELILEIGETTTMLKFSANGVRADFFGRTKTRVAKLLEVVATKLSLPLTTQPLGVLMASGGAGSQPPTPGHTPLSEDLVRVVFEAESSVALDGEPYGEDLSNYMPPEDAEALQHPRKRRRTEDDDGIDDAGGALPTDGQEWAIKTGQFRLRIQESRGGKSALECVFVAVKIDAVSSERGRNKMRRFLGD